MNENLACDTTLPDGRRIDELKVAELKKELDLRGLNKNGVKKDLIKRLAEALVSMNDVSKKINVVEAEKLVETSVPESSKPVQTLNTLATKSSANDAPCTNDLHDLQTENRNSETTSVSSEEIEIPILEKTPFEEAIVHVSETALPKEQKVELISSSNSEITLEKLANPLTVEVPPALVVVTEPKQFVMNDENAHLSTARLVDNVSEEEAEEEDYGDEEEETGDPKASISTLTPHQVFCVNGEKSVNVIPENLLTTKSTTLSDSAKLASNSQDTNFSNGPKETRGVGYLIEVPERVNPSQLAKCPPSTLVYIRYLVRPFTLGTFTKMIEQHFGEPAKMGTSVWLDKIKSSAVVRMPSLEAAINCREGLDGCRWPSINPRVLQCDFASEELFDWLKKHGESGDMQPPRHLLLGMPGPGDGALDVRETMGKRFMPLCDDKIDAGVGDHRREKRRRLDDDENGAKAKPVKKIEEPTKKLDDLFKKTATIPSVYWLPLSDVEAQAQMERRMERYAIENTRRSAAAVPRRNNDGKRETRSPFAGSCVAEGVNTSKNNFEKTMHPPPMAAAGQSRKTVPSGRLRERSPFTPPKGSRPNFSCRPAVNNRSKRSPALRRSPLHSSRRHSRSLSSSRSGVPPSAPCRNNQRRSPRTPSPPFRRR